MIQLRIKEIAKEKGVTLNELAERVDLTQVSISRIVNAAAKPSLSALDRIAKALDVEVYELFNNAPRVEIDPDNVTVCPHCNTPIKITIK